MRTPHFLAPLNPQIPQHNSTILKLLTWNQTVLESTTRIHKFCRLRDIRAHELRENAVPVPGIFR